jgi:tetratricopeptide (TPR) repeat protein
MIINALLKSVFATLILFLFSSTAFAQLTAKEEKSVEKSKQYYRDGKYEKAVSTLKKVQSGDFNRLYKNGTLWELRCLYEYDRYNDQLIKDIMSILKGKKMSHFKSSDYRIEMILACYQATMYCENQEFASDVLHGEIVAPSTDTAVSDDAREQYGKGGEEYDNKNYSGAIRYYEKALKEDSNYYKATYKMGMCYFKDEKYEKAAPWFKKATKLVPEMLDPYVKLIDCYYEDKKWQEAFDACVDGIIAYPYEGHFKKLSEICDKLGKTFDRHWMCRDYMPNMITATSQSPITEDPWSYYRQAKDKIGDYCNDDGIIKKSQDLTQMKHLESYSWEFMLKKAGEDAKGMSFANRMQKEGYLDCYAMVSLFHVVFWDQYKDFASKNKDRIRKYIETQLVK